jgi:hypothetical protein
MILQKIKTIPVALILGGAAGIATAITAPQYVGSALAFSGGLLGGAAVVERRREEQEIKREQATRVSTCFSTLYEKNQGLIDPVQLAFFSNISVDRAHAFLTSLAEGNNGQKIPTDQGVGVVFNFPHPDNVLERLSKNAAEWAQAQTQKLEEELEQYKRAVQFMQAQQAASSLTPKAAAREQDPWVPQPGI